MAISKGFSHGLIPRFPVYERKPTKQLSLAEMVNLGMVKTSTDISSLKPPVKTKNCSDCGMPHSHSLNVCPNCGFAQDLYLKAKKIKTERASMSGGLCSSEPVSFSGTWTTKSQPVKKPSELFDPSNDIAHVVVTKDGGIGLGKHSQLDILKSWNTCQSVDEPSPFAGMDQLPPCQPQYYYQNSSATNAVAFTLDSMSGATTVSATAS